MDTYRRQLQQYADLRDQMQQVDDRRDQKRLKIMACITSVSTDSELKDFLDDNFSQLAQLKMFTLNDNSRKLGVILFENEDLNFSLCLLPTAEIVGFVFDSNRNSYCEIRDSVLSMRGFLMQMAQLETSHQNVSIGD